MSLLFIHAHNYINIIFPRQQHYANSYEYHSCEGHYNLHHSFLDGMLLWYTMPCMLIPPSPFPPVSHFFYMCPLNPRTLESSSMKSHRILELLISGYITQMLPCALVVPFTTQQWMRAQVISPTHFKTSSGIRHMKCTSEQRESTQGGAPTMSLLVSTQNTLMLLPMQEV